MIRAFSFAFHSTGNFHLPDFSAVPECSSCGNLLRFPTGQHFEAVISGLGGGRHDREPTANRTAYRKRVLGIVVLCSTLLLISGVVAIMIGWNVNLTRLSTVSMEATAVSPSTN